MNFAIKSLTLSVEDIARLIHISDMEERRQVMHALINGAQDPEKEIDKEAFRGSHPMALRIAQKIRRKAVAAERRRQRKELKKMEEAKKPKPAEVKPVKPRPEPTPDNDNVMEPITFRNDDVVTLELNKATVGRLLWLKQNHRSWCQAIRAIITALAGSDIPSRIAAQIMYLLDRLFDYFTPLINQAATYHHTPRNRRPRFATA